MYLSRLILNPRSREVRRDLADCQAMHRRVMAAFPDGLPEGEARASLGVLYRCDQGRDGRLVLLVQSRVAPEWSGLAEGYLLDTGGEPENPAHKEVGGLYGRGWGRGCGSASGCART